MALPPPGDFRNDPRRLGYAPLPLPPELSGIAACEGEPPKNSNQCQETSHPFSEILRGRSFQAQADFLNELNPGLREIFFGLLIEGRGRQEAARLFVELPAEQTPPLLALFPDPERTQIMAEVQLLQPIKGETIRTIWREALSSDFRIRSRAESIDLDATLRELPTEMLWRSYQNCEAQERQTGRPNAATGRLGVELTRRKGEILVAGNGVNLPQEENGYRNLRLTQYLNQETWMITGEFWNRNSRRWSPFRYQHDIRSFYRELWLHNGARMEFLLPTGAQEQFMKASVFGWAREATRGTPPQQSPEKTLLPEGSTPLAFDRVEQQQPTHTVFGEREKPLDILSGQARGKTLPIGGPTWTYYFNSHLGHTVKIFWDENADQLRVDLFLRHGQPPAPQYSGPIDDRRARELLPLIRSLKGETEADNQALQRLANKLQAISDFI